MSIRSSKKGGISKVKNILNTKVGKEEKKKIGIEARREFWLKWGGMEVGKKKAESRPTEPSGGLGEVRGRDVISPENEGDESNPEGLR